MLVITLGDPHSVNIELLTGLLAQQPELTKTHSVVLVGSLWQWHDQCRRLDRAPLPLQQISRPAEAQRPGLYFAPIDLPLAEAPAEGLSSVVRGSLSLRSLEWLRQCNLPGQRLAVVTAPIDKHASAQAGFSHGGQTEFFEALWGSQAVMILAGPKLRVALVTNHLALRDVPAAIDSGLIGLKLDLFINSLRTVLQQKHLRIAVCGLNPHAGDQGLFGDEEQLKISPAVFAAQAKYAPLGIEVVGPVPADTAFYHGYHGAYSGVLAMYHDQGLGPLKTVHFDNAVNLSGGLKHLRVSPDHGPAKDLFLQRRAVAASMETALSLAATYLSAPHHQDLTA